MENIIYVCKLCGKENDGTFGKGIFCSKSCQSKYAHSFIKERPKTYKKHNSNKIWKCKYCKITFSTRKELFSHYKLCEIKNSLPKDSKGRTISSDVVKGHKKQSEAVKNNNKIRGTSNYGHSQSAETRAKIAKSFLNKKDIFGNFQANFNEKACKYIDSLNQEKGWNLKHALNGGEKRVGPYYLDGYDQELNIAFEYDEKYHHRNKNIEERDKLRQEYIISQLKCEFWRYDEKMGLLYKVD